MKRISGAEKRGNRFYGTEVHTGQERLPNRFRVRGAGFERKLGS